MKATCWMGRNNVEVENVPDPKILNDRDAIVRITSTAICGSDLHLVRRLRADDEAAATSSATSSWARSSRSGRGVDEPEGRRPRRRAVPDRLRQLLRRAGTSSTRSARTRTRTRGSPRSCSAIPTAGIFGYSHLTGGFAGGQAEYARVPFADVGPIKIENGLADEQVLFLSDIFPTGYMGAEFCDIKGGDVDRGLGRRARRPVRAASAQLLGAERVIADRPLRLPAADGAREPRRRDARTTRRSTASRRR